MSSPKMVLAHEPDTISWQRTADWVEAKSGFLAIALCVCFAGMSLAIAARRPFWYDEIITISIARAPAIKDLFSGFLVGYDQTPPLNVLLIRLVCSLFGWTELVARLPSIVFVTAGVLILFHRVRTLANGLSALAAISALFVTFLPRYAYEARPYAMLFFASVLAVWSWTWKPEAARSSRRVPLFFGLAMMLAVFAHYYGVLLILPFAADEWRNRGLRELMSFRLLCGGLGLAIGLVVQFPFVYAASRRRLIHFWAVPSFHNLQDAYVEILALFIFVLVCALPLFAWIGSKSGAASVGPQSRDERLGWLFLPIPAAGYVLAELVTHAFTVRYFVPVLSGLGLAFGCFLYRYYRSTPHVPLLVLLVAVPLYLETSVEAFRYARTSVISGRTGVADFADEMLPQFRKEGKMFVLLPRGRSPLETRYYAAYPEMVRALHQPDLPTLPFASDPLHIHYFSMDDVRRFAREIAFVAPKPDLLNNLNTWGFHLRWRKTEPEAVVYAE